MRSRFKEVNIFYILLIAVSSFLWFVIKWRTAYESPANDMMPFFERYFNKAYLLNDFYTNAISNEPNPRHIFGYLILGLAALMGAEWYTIVYAFKVALVLLMPVLYYLVLYLAAGRFLYKEGAKVNQLLIFFAVFIIMYPRASGLFSVAWWTPYLIQTNAQTVSLFFGFIAILLKESERKYTRAASVLLFALSTLIHPVIGLLTIVFFVMTDFQALKRHIAYFFAVAVGGLLIPMLIINVFFGPAAPVDTKTFIDIYVLQNHEAHYHVADFGSLLPFSWKYSYALMITLLIIPLVCFYRTRNRMAFILASFFLAGNILAVLCQYIFIDVMPVKAIASVGPSRLMQFTYWMIAILWVILLSPVAWLAKWNFHYRLNCYALAAALVCLWIAGICLKDSPKKDLLSRNKLFYDFLSTTDSSSIFAAYYGDYLLDIPNIGDRAIFIGNGFPFNESYFKEFQKRKDLMYGSKDAVSKIPGRWIGEKYDNFYRNLGPADFSRIAQECRLDYIVVEKDHSEQFRGFTPGFENEKIRVYHVTDF